jgi:excinuclease ABC subunit B
MTPQQLDKAIANTKRLMQAAAAKMDFLEAAQYRDEMFKLETLKAELVK